MDIAWSHKTNALSKDEVGPRGFFVRLAGDFEGINVLQIDKGSDQTLFDNDTSPQKEHSTAILLNLLLERGTASVNGGIFPAKLVVITDAEFNIERIIDVHDKPYSVSGLSQPFNNAGGIDPNKLPWRVEFTTPFVQ